MAKRVPGVASYLMKQSFKRVVKDAYRRITLNWITISFFLFSFIHCFAQGIIQSFLFSIDNDYDSLTSRIVHEANISNKAVPYLTGTYGSLNLELCWDVPLYYSETCHRVFPPDEDNLGTVDLTTNGSRTISIEDTITFKANNSFHDKLGVVSVTLVSEDNPDGFLLQPACTETMLYVQHLFSQVKREDVSWIALQFWLFFISFITILSDSIPHTLTVLMSRVLATSWSAYAIWRTHHRRRVTDELITNPRSACSVDLLPTYFDTRLKYEIPDLLLNCTALAISIYLSVTLLRVYSRQSFKVMGAPKRVVRIQKFFNSVLSVLQLEVFVVLVAMALWIDELSNGPIAKVSSYSTIYRGGVILTAVSLWPWIALGWYSIRRESVVGIYIFLGFAIAPLIFGWSFMFYSQVYRWTYFDWPFFGGLATASLLLLVASFILGLICRLNFGKGLKEYMQAESALSSTGIEPQIFTHDVEKAPISPDIEDDSTADLLSLPPLSLQIPTPTYYVPELRSASPSVSPAAADRVLEAKRMSVFEDQLYTFGGARPASPPLALSPLRADRPIVHVTKLAFVKD